MSSTDLLLEPLEVAKLTGIRGGHKGKTREQRQIAQLKAQKIPFYVTAGGRPAVVRAIIEGGKPAAAAAPAQSWEPQI